MKKEKENDLEELDEDMDFLEEGDISQKVLVLGGIGVVILVIILCIVIWNVNQKGNDAGPSDSKEDTTQEDSSQQEIALSDDLESLTEDEILEDEPEPIATQPSTSVDGGTAGGMQSGDESGLAFESKNMSFQEISDVVTAKEATNLRSEPSLEGGDSTIVVLLKNGETVTRTGVNSDLGWSRLEYNGQVVYAVSRYLTTDLESKPVESKEPEAPPQTNTVTPQSDGNTVVTLDGRSIVFTSCDDKISPKIQVNLRGEPSTAQGNGTVHYQIEYGEVIRRTGISEDSGWSRVEYNGETLYVVTSYIYVVEE